MAERSQGLGFPFPLDQGSLPTEASTFNYYLKVRENVRHNVPLKEVVMEVIGALKCQWEKTDIPNYFETNSRKVEKKVMQVINSGRQLMKTPVNRRDADFGSEMNKLIDFSVCLHADIESCTCPPSCKVCILLL